jgi:hypothetical protein
MPDEAERAAAAAGAGGRLDRMVELVVGAAKVKARTEELEPVVVLGLAGGGLRVCALGGHPLGPLNLARGLVGASGAGCAVFCGEAWTTGGVAGGGLRGEGVLVVGQTAPWLGSLRIERRFLVIRDPPGPRSVLERPAPEESAPPAGGGGAERVDLYAPDPPPP